MSLAECREHCKAGDPRWWSYPGRPDQPTQYGFNTAYCIDPWRDGRLSYTHRSCSGTQEIASRNLPCSCRLEAVRRHPDVLVSISVCHCEYHSYVVIFVRYADTQDEDWLIGSVPGDPSLFVATGGSGHAYKVTLMWDLNLFPDVPVCD